MKVRSGRAESVGGGEEGKGKVAKTNSSVGKERKTTWKALQPHRQRHEQADKHGRKPERLLTAIC